MSELDFETGQTIWVVHFYHSGPGSVWADTLNAKNEQDALLECLEKFKSEGLNPVMIYRVETQEFNVVGEVE